MNRIWLCNFLSFLFQIWVPLTLPCAPQASIVSAAAVIPAGSRSLSGTDNNYFPSNNLVVKATGAGRRAVVVKGVPPPPRPTGPIPLCPYSSDARCCPATVPLLSWTGHCVRCPHCHCRLTQGPCSMCVPDARFNGGGFYCVPCGMGWV